MEFSWMLQGRAYKLGHDVPHMGGVVPMRVVSEQWFEPKDIIPQLFVETDPGFHERCKPGDIIVTGRNFGMGPKMQGYIAMQALGLGLVCESMPFLAYREAIGLGLPVLVDCTDVTSLCATGDELEVDYRSGKFKNRTRNIERIFPPVPIERIFPPVPEALHEILELGGTTNWLKQWWAKEKAA
jgi:3-isopropylmalate/(R)-2-methylmalate dehydratase small subunit